MTPWLTILEATVLAAGIAALYIVFTLSLFLRKWEARGKDEWRKSMRQSADRQAAELEHRKRRNGPAASERTNRLGRKGEFAMTELIWLRIAARHLLTFWPDFGMVRAIRELRDCLPDQFGHPDYDWSEEAARELAEEYIREFGEHYGSNH